jgi:hypothetical protein
MLGKEPLRRNGEREAIFVATGDDRNHPGMLIGIDDLFGRKMA